MHSASFSGTGQKRRPHSVVRAHLFKFAKKLRRALIPHHVFGVRADREAVTSGSSEEEGGVTTTAVEGEGVEVDLGPFLCLSLLFLP